MEGVYLHILADTLGSFGVIVSSLLIEWFGLMIADPISSAVIGVLTFGSALPLLRRSLNMLMQAAPKRTLDKMAMVYDRLGTMPNVESFSEVRIWSVSSNNVVGTVKIVPAAGARLEAVSRNVINLFSSAGVNDMGVHFDFPRSSTVASGSRQASGVAPLDGSHSSSRGVGAPLGVVVQMA